MFCAAENCDKDVVYNSGFCNAHYQRLRLYGRLETVVWGQTNHPLYGIWNARKNSNLLSRDWLDFKNFVIGVGERPDKNYKLVRLTKNEPFGPDNFKWFRWLNKKSDETNKEFQVRRRQETKLLNPDFYKSLELNKNFGITLQKYNEMLWLQSGVCKICKQKEKVKHHKTGEVKSLAVDHCHKTGKIRGLLCSRCNRVLGKINDNVVILDAMKAYLNDYS